VLATLAKELRETLRDRRTLAVMVLLPLVVYPLIALVAMQVVSVRAQSQDARPSQVAIEGDAPLLSEVRSRLEREAKAFVVKAEATAATPAEPGGDEALRTGRWDAIVRLAAKNEADSSPDPATLGSDEAPAAPPASAGPTLEIAFDATRDESRKAEERLAERLELLASPGPPRFATKRRNVAQAADLGGYALSKALPLIIVLMVLLGSFYPAIDVTAGERERGTLETLLAAPVRRTEILLGKVLAVTALATLTGVLNLLSMSLTVGQMLRLARSTITLGIPWERTAAMSAVIVPTAFLLAGLFVAVGALARGFKEAQNLLVPAYFLFIAPAMVGVLGDFPLRGFAALVPGMNVTLLARDLALGKAGAGAILLVLGATIACGAICVRLAARHYTSETFLDPAAARVPGQAAAPRTGPPTAGEALALYALALLLLLFVFAPLQQRHLTSGLLLSQWGGLLGLVLLYARVARRHLRDVLGLGRPAPGALVGGLIMGSSAWIVVGLAAHWLDLVPREVAEQLRKAVTTPTPGGLLGNIVIVAVTPAICEEALFRGPLLRGLLARLAPGGAIVLCGILFGLFHLSPWRLLPTTALGCMMAWIAWRSGSLLPAMLAHLANNGLLVALAHASRDDLVERWPWPIQAAACGGAALLVGIGAVLLRRSARAA
jgi:sodium transport system permease protein